MKETIERVRLLALPGSPVPVGKEGSGEGAAGQGKAQGLLQRGWWEHLEKAES